MILFRKISEEWAKIKLEYFTTILLLLIFIHSNSKFKTSIKTRTLNASMLGLMLKRNNLKFLTLHTPFCLFIIIKWNKILKLSWLIIPEYFGIYLFWRNHQMLFKVVHFSPKERKILSFTISNVSVIHKFTTHFVGALNDWKLIYKTMKPISNVVYKISLKLPLHRFWTFLR